MQPARRGAFDLATAFETVYFWPGLEKCFAEVCRILKPGGTFPICNESDGTDETSSFASAVGKAGADFKRQFTPESYRRFFVEAGYYDVEITMAEGRIPCAVAVMKKKG